MASVGGGLYIRAESASLEQTCPLIFAQCASLEDEVKLLDEIREHVAERPERLKMDNWHCGTAHCLAGWAETLRPDTTGKNTCDIGTKLLPRTAHLFYADDARALSYLINREYAK